MAAKKKAKKKTAAKRAPARKAAPKKKKGAAKKSARTSARRATAAKRKPAKKAKSAAKKPAVRLVKPRPPKPATGGPPPPPPDATEISGIYERVMFSENDPYQEVREIFGRYDRDKSGAIEASEFARLCEALGMEEEEDVLQAGLSVVDADGDGKISWDEFLGWWRSLGR